MLNVSLTVTKPKRIIPDSAVSARQTFLLDPCFGFVACKRCSHHPIFQLQQANVFHWKISDRQTLPAQHQTTNRQRRVADERTALAAEGTDISPQKLKKHDFWLTKN